jgi:carboxyl-terminal processing protease
MKAKTKILYSAGSALLIAGVFVLGTYVGYAHRPYVERVAGISNTSTPVEVSADFDPFWKVWNTIDQKYPGAKDVSAQDRVYGAIQGLVGSLNDPYSVYFPPQDSKDFEDTINGSFEGVGMEVGIKDKVLTVIAPLKDTPAERSGIRAGDMILKIDTTSTNDMSVDKAVRLIRGKQGTAIKLTIFREGEKEPREISIMRDVINIPTLETEKKDNGVFIIHLYNFGASSASQTEEALREFKASGNTKLVMDLRGNPGGYLDAAVSIASFFLPEGDVVVTESFGTKDSDRVYRSKGYNLLDMKKTQVVVLVDKGSASASEILAGALKEHNVAPLIGETTYGKGSVQEVIDVTDTTTLKLTIARWLTPNGTSISKKGLDPDIKVETTAKDFENKKDPVMNRALQYFKDGK